jgi:thiol-disulfide isomerase/thioredoxin
MKKELIFAAATVIGIAGGLYLASTGGETPTLPETDFSQIADMREGDMLKLQLGVDRGSDVVFMHEDGSDLTLAAYDGKLVVLNFWATWCAPCRKEMPHLSELQTEMGGADFEVVTIATGTNQRPAMERFLAEIGVENLPLHTDNNSALARDMGVVGLPVTIILNADGFEIGRLIGDADWASDNAKAILAALQELK